MANNPYINQLIYAGNVLMDLTNDTVDAAHLAKNYTAHDKSGAPITGTMEGGIHPSGTVEITTTNYVDVTNYQGAQVLDLDLAAENIKKDVNILGVVGTYTGSGGIKSVQYNTTWAAIKGSTTAFKTSGVSLTCAKSGTYTATISTYRSSTSYVSFVQLYVNGTAYGTAQSAPASTQRWTATFSVTLNADDVVEVYVKNGSTSAYTYIGAFILDEQ